MRNVTASADSHQLVALINPFQGLYINRTHFKDPPEFEVKFHGVYLNL